MSHLARRAARPSRSFRLYNTPKGLTTSRTRSMSSDTAHLVPDFAANFPASTARPSSIFPFPGVTAESTRVVRKTLEENDKTCDIWEKTRFFHNHLPHSALTRYALGAPARLLEDIWMSERKSLVSLDPAGSDRKEDLSKIPEKITRDNWDDPKYLGNKPCYSRYLAFFHKEITRLGPVGTIEEYVFSPQANYASSNGHPGAHMLVRLVAGFLHPFIHAGFGVEFRDRLTLAEGLAEAVNHDAGLYLPLYGEDWPKSLPQQASSSPVESDGTSGTPADQTPSSWEITVDSRIPKRGKSLLEIYNDVCASEKCAPVAYDSDMLLNDRISGALEGEKGPALRALASEWSLTDEELGDGPAGWRVKFEELAILATMLCGATGRTGREPRVDFFLMHCLTSSLFLPAYLEVLSLPNRRALLSTYCMITLLLAIGRGRPKLNPELVMSYNLFPVAPGTNASKSTRDSASDPTNPDTRNAWLSLIESSLYAHDSHVPKSIRSLAHHDQQFGHIRAGEVYGAYRSDGSETIEGIGQVDGSVFLRVAGVIMDTTGWVREGQKEGDWDRSALGYDEAWE